jgi:hypothetical protein
MPRLERSALKQRFRCCNLLVHGELPPGCSLNLGGTAQK